MDKTIKTLERALRTARALKRGVAQLAADIDFATDEPTPTPKRKAEVNMQIDSEYEKDLHARGITALLDGGGKDNGMG